MSHLQTVKMDFVRYANVWEDAAVLRQGLRLAPGERALSICSGGDNCFALLLDDPALVVAADLNTAQLHLVELKMAAIAQLDYPTALAFLGFSNSDRRSNIYQKLRPHLGGESQRFWDERRGDVEAGIIHCGKFERYFQLFARKVLPFIHGKKTIEGLFEHKSSQKQEEYYEQRWNTWRWRFLFRLFFSKSVMGTIGRDRAFLKEVKVGVGGHIFQKAAAQLKSPQAQANHILRYNLTGAFGPCLPDYLADEGTFLTVRERLGRVRLFQGFAQDAAPFGPFDAMNLSDIFEYMSGSLFEQTGQKLWEIAAPGCRIAYWNLMVPRRLSETLPQMFGYQENLSSALSRKDRGFFYDRFIVDTKTQ